jgi:hypothetical protein
MKTYVFSLCTIGDKVVFSTIGDQDISSNKDDSSYCNLVNATDETDKKSMNSYYTSGENDLSKKL